MVIGAFLVGKYWRQSSKFLLIFTGFTIMGLFLIFLTLTGAIPEKLLFQVHSIDLFGHISKAFDLTARMLYTYLIATIIGFGSALISIPENMRGKVFGVQFTLLSTSSTLPVLIVALVSEYIGLVYLLILIGLPLLIFGGLGLHRVRKKL